MADKKYTPKKGISLITKAGIKINGEEVTKAMVGDNFDALIKGVQLVEVKVVDKTPPSGREKKGNGGTPPVELENIKKQLSEKGITYNEEATLEELQKLLDDAGKTDKTPPSGGGAQRN
jgi:hypothetical protein